MNKLAELLGHKQIKTIDELDLTYWQKLGEMHFNDLNKLSMKFACTKDERQESDGKLYLIANNKKIVKFGGSQTKGGIESTINAYLNGFRVGQSKRTYSIWNYLQKELKENNNIEIWFMKLPTVRTAIPSFSGDVNKKTMSVDYHTIEKEFVDDYYKVNGEYPLLNIQEGGKKWEDLGLSEGWPGMGK